MTSLFAIADRLEQSGALDEAIVEYGRLIASGEGGIEPLVRRAGLNRQSGRMSEAQDDLDAAARIEPANPWPLLQLAQLARASGRNLAEAAYAQAAVDVAPEDCEMRINAAAAYLRLDWLDLAYHAVRDLSGDLSDWWASTRDAALTRYRTEHAATRMLLRTRHEAGDRILLAWMLAQHLYRLGRLTIARRLCEALMREMPHSFPAFFFCSRIVAR